MRSDSEQLRPSTLWSSPLHLVPALLVSCLTAGCGYQMSAEAGDGTTPSSLYRGDVKTVAVPVFANRTFWRGVEFQLSKAVVNDLESHTPYKVVPRERADTVLEGEIQRVRVRTLSNSPLSAEPQEQLYYMTVDFTWKDLRSGKILVERRGFEQTAPYYPTLGEGRFVASQLNVERLARAIVGELEAEWGNIK